MTPYCSASLGCGVLSSRRGYPFLVWQLWSCWWREALLHSTPLPPVVDLSRVRTQYSAGNCCQDHYYTLHPIVLSRLSSRLSGVCCIWKRMCMMLSRSGWQIQFANVLSWLVSFVRPLSIDFLSRCRRSPVLFIPSASHTYYVSLLVPPTFASISSLLVAWWLGQACLQAACLRLRPTFPRPICFTYCHLSVTSW